MRTVLIHLNVAVPDDDPRDAEQIGAVLMGAVEVGIDPNDPTLAALGVEAVLVEEV